MEIPITEEYTDPLGRFNNYDTLDNITQTILDGQQHVDLRRMTNVPSSVPHTMFSLDLIFFNVMDTMLMSDMEGTAVSTPSDGWTTGIAGPTSSIGLRNALVMDIFANAPQGSGENILSHELVLGEMGDQVVDNMIVLPGVTISPNQNTSTSVTSAIDLTIVPSDWTLSVALPFFPASSLILSSCTMTLSDGTNQVILPFSTSLTPLIDGNSELSFPKSAWGAVLKPTTITFSLTASANCIVTFAAIRMLAPTWTFVTLDSQTIDHKLIPTVGRDGGIPGIEILRGELITGGGGLPTPGFAPYPTVWRSDDPPGLLDPRPINVKLCALIYTGSLLNTNSLTLYARERQDVPQTQLDLNGVDVTGDGIVDLGFDQQKLENRSYQPDYGEALYAIDSQETLDTHIQSDLEAMILPGYPSLDGGFQAFIERLPDNINLSFIGAILSWGPTSTTLTVQNYMVDLTTFVQSTGGLSPNSLYLLTLDVEESTVRATLDPVNANGVVQSSSRVLDSGVLKDDFKFKRIAGRVGWSVNLLDGDSFINNFRTQHLIYGEYQSHTLESYTPVDGTRLTVSASPAKELYTGAGSYRGAQVGIDTDGSLKVRASATQGLLINPVRFDDFSISTISFDLNWPSIATSQGTYPSVVLSNGLQYIALSMGRITPDQWTHYEIIPTQAFNAQTGSYNLIIFHNTGATFSWNIRNISIQQRTMGWSARSALQDPWNANPIPWVDFGDILNDESNGIVLSPRGRFLQIRGQAFSQTAFVDKIFARPKYAQLGRPLFNTNPLIPLPQVSIGVSPVGPQISQSTVVDGITNNYTWNAYQYHIGTLLTFTANLTELPPGITAARYTWDFGDGTTASGSTATHTYTALNPSVITTLNVLLSDGRVVDTTLPMSLVPIFL